MERRLVWKPIEHSNEHLLGFAGIELEVVLGSPVRYGLELYDGGISH